MNTSSKEISVLLDTLDYRFQDQRLLTKALTHSSSSAIHWDRLEFLGDSVLGLIISEHLFQLHKNIPEGRLSVQRSHLVRKETLYQLGSALNLERCIILGRSFKQHEHIPQSMIADAFEALIGAIYLDGGLDACRPIVIALYQSTMAETFTSLTDKDAKTKLQELCQKNKLSMPIYEDLPAPSSSETSLFFVSVSIAAADLKCTSKGDTKKKAQMNAALMMLDLLDQQAKQKK